MHTRLRQPHRLFAIPLIAASVGCGGAEPQQAAAPEPAPAPAPTAEQPKPPAEPEPETDEQRAERERLEKLAKDLEKLRHESEEEAARFDEELEAKVAKLADTSWWNADAALKKVLASPHRYPGNADRDEFRHPLETLKFFGLKPNMTVLEVGAGSGWYTEILAPVLAKRGQLIITSRNWDGPETERNTYYGRRVRYFLDKSKALSGKIRAIVIDRQDLDLKLDGEVDLAIAMREMHNWHRSGARVPHNLAQVFKALKPGGIFGVVQHRAPEGANPDESAEKGYLPEAWVIEQAKAAGFELAGKSEVNANPKDTKDYAEGVWTLPPSLKLGDVKRAEYEAIGESDRMTLKFRKPKK